LQFKLHTISFKLQFTFRLLLLQSRLLLQAKPGIYLLP